MSIFDRFRSLMSDPEPRIEQGSSAQEHQNESVPEVEPRDSYGGHRDVPPVRDERHRPYAEDYSWFRTPERTARWTLEGMERKDLETGWEWAVYTYDEDEIEAIWQALEQGGELSPLVQHETIQTAEAILASRLKQGDNERLNELFRRIVRGRNVLGARALAERMGSRWLGTADERFIEVLVQSGAGSELARRGLSDDQIVKLVRSEFSRGEPAWNFIEASSPREVFAGVIEWMKTPDAKMPGFKDLERFGPALGDTLVEHPVDDRLDPEITVTALGYSTRDEAEARIIEYLDLHGDAATASKALRKLGKPPAEIGLFFLGRSLKNERLKGAQILKPLPLDESQVEAAREALEKERTAEVKEALEGLLRKYETRSPEDRLEERVRRFLRDDAHWRDEKWRDGSAVGAAEKLGDRSIDFLISQLDAGDIDVRRRAIRLLRHLAPEDLATCLLEVLPERRAIGPRVDIIAAIAEASDFSPEELDTFFAGQAIEPPDEIDVESLPRLRWRTTEDVSLGTVKTILELLRNADRIEDMGFLREHLDRDSSSALWHGLRTQLGDDHDEVRIGWVLAAATVLGREVDISGLGRSLNKLASSGFVQQAMKTIDVLAIDGSAESIQRIDFWSRNAKTPVFRKHAKRALDRIAEKRGWTREELLERTIPTLGFDEDSTRPFEFGARGMLVISIDHDGDVTMVDDNGKVWKRIPGKLVDDDDDEYLALRESLKNLRREIRESASLVRDNLIQAMTTRRSWDRETFEEVWVDNPFARSFAMGLVWLLEADEPVECRLDESLALVDIDDREIDFEDSARLRIPHPIELNDPDTWAQVMVDFELVAPFEQLSRKTFDEFEPEKLAGLDPRKVMRITRRFGFLSDGDGHVDRMYRELGSTSLRIELSPGYHVSYPEGLQDLSVLFESDDPIEVSEAALVWHRIREASVD